MSPIFSIKHLYSEKKDIIPPPPPPPKKKKKKRKKGKRRKEQISAKGSTTRITAAEKYLKTGENKQSKDKTGTDKQGEQEEHEKHLFFFSFLS